MAEAASPVNLNRSPKESNPGKYAAKTTNVASAATSLTDLCRLVITSNLERYPPEAFCIIDEDEWETLISVRHRRTQPKDGSERLVPAVPEKTLHAVEECCPHLSVSHVTDELVWKDCVEFRFRRGGLTRPVVLNWPWPFLVRNLQRAAETLRSATAKPSVVTEAIRTLKESPMNVALLRDSGVGKTVKKVIKKADPAVVGLDGIRQLQNLLQSWMELAAKNGVEVKLTPSKRPAKEDDVADDLKLAESCQSWRHLFAVLKRREEELRTSQGKRMRDIRKNLAETRPKLVKVRPATAKQQRILERYAMSAHRSATAAGGNGKITKIRQEAMIQAARQQRPAAAVPKGSFGDAVAFASGTKKGAAHRQQKIGGTLHHLGGGKRMKVPTKVVKGAGPRQLASKWKTK